MAVRLWDERFFVGTPDPGSPRFTSRPEATSSTCDNHNFFHSATWLPYRSPNDKELNEKDKPSVEVSSEESEENRRRRKDSSGVVRAGASLDHETHVRRQHSYRPFARRAGPRPAPFYGFTLDDLDELAGYVAAEANHAKIKKLEKDLRQLYRRIAEVLESHTDEPGESTP